MVKTVSNLSILIAGVGGQGTLLASRILGSVAMKKGYDVKVSEVHGMSQRGGSVVTYVRMGEKVHSPIVEKRMADIVLAFERLEALRWIDYLKDGGKLIINDQRINPMPVIMGKEKYPENIVEKIKRVFPNTQAMDALSIARACGNARAINVVLIGLMAKSTAIEKEVWLEAIRENVPPKYLEVNMNAFEAGYNAV